MRVTQVGLYICNERAWCEVLCDDDYWNCNWIEVKNLTAPTRLGERVKNMLCETNELQLYKEYNL